MQPKAMPILVYRLLLLRGVFVVLSVSFQFLGEEMRLGCGMHHDGLLEVEVEVVCSSKVRSVQREAVAARQLNFGTARRIFH
ncbi:hypothetical protein B0T13DRAFT_10236 [Neurospora crassa]|nr:hypothetical protein B0T13DRAFT_10236 [Neurospora crassa]